MVSFQMKSVKKKEKKKTKNEQTKKTQATKTTTTKKKQWSDILIVILVNVSYCVQWKQWHAVV